MMFLSLGWVLALRVAVPASARKANHRTKTPKFQAQNEIPDRKASLRFAHGACRG
jgi:hypothetical protein